MELDGRAGETQSRIEVEQQLYYRVVIPGPMRSSLRPIVLPMGMAQVLDVALRHSMKEEDKMRRGVLVVIVG